MQGQHGRGVVQRGVPVLAWLRGTPRTTPKGGATEHDPEQATLV